MILINVLPPEMRKKGLSRAARGGQRRLLRGLGLGFLAITLLFYVQYLLSMGRYGKLQKQWQGLQGDIGRVNALRSELDTGVRQEKEFLETNVFASPPTTQLFQSVSVFLPNSVWLEELKLSRHPKDHTLLLKGLSLPSKETSSIRNIERYLQSIKEGLPGDANVVLMTSRKQDQSFEVTLFTAVFKWQEKMNEAA